MKSKPHTSNQTSHSANGGLPDSYRESVVCGPIKHDGILSIATASYRKSKSWKNRELLWSELVAKFADTKYTSETHAEYLKSTKSRQAEIKDVGGFVGGHVLRGRRRKGLILSRTVLTLDADYIRSMQDFLDSAELCISDMAYCLYSTHKHTPDNARLRLVLPLSREVDAHEYEAIGRYIASLLDIELFDDTTYQMERLMYWPSTSKDAEFFFYHNDASFLNVDAILKAYPGRDGWKDSTQWPVSSRQKEAVARAVSKQEDPTAKAGIIGAFCRSFTIEEVIETHLTDQYEPVDNDDNRYTYIHGSTAGGLVIYDHKFAYSHHGTDPISGQLCNAFDLVRIHKYLHLDDDTSDRTPIGKRPSFKAMEDFAAAIPEVRQLLIREKTESAAGDFDDGFTVEEEDAGEWMEQLEVSRKGDIQNGLDNIVIILLHDSQLKGKIIYEEFSERTLAAGDLPWRSAGQGAYIDDADISNLKHFLKKKYKVNATSVAIEDALNVIAQRNRVNEVKDYLNSLVWDGEKRLDYYLTEMLGAADNEYTRAIGRKTLVAAVARVYQPGIKFDYMLTLIGPQGIGKSTLVAKLGGKWFTDSFSFDMLRLGNKAYEQLQGAWLVEAGELNGLRKAEVEAAKSFLTSKEDRYRVAYGRRVSHFPRRCIFIGTTNNEIFLRDQTGNRRFWPVTCGVEPQSTNVWEGLTRYVRNQLWAEAVVVWKSGKETLYLSKETEDYANKLREGHTEADDRVGMIEDFINRKLPTNWDVMTVHDRRAFIRDGGAENTISGPVTVVRERVCAGEIWCELFGGDRDKMGAHNTRFIHEAMRKIEGWEASKSKLTFPVYGKQAAYLNTGFDGTVQINLRFQEDKKGKDERTVRTVERTEDIF